MEILCDGTVKGSSQIVHSQLPYEKKGMWNSMLRKRVTAVILIGLIASFWNVSNLPVINASENVQHILADRPIIVAHRGASSLAPENTLAAVKKGIEVGAQWIEIDVHQTRDHHLVVLHDEDLDRTTNGSGPVNQYTLAELRQLDAGSWFSSEFAGERIPTLREVLATTRDKAILLIELKGSSVEKPTIELVREMNMEKQVVIQSFDHDAVANAKALAPEIPTMILVKEPSFASNPQIAARWMVKRAEKKNADGIGIHFSYLTNDLVKLAEERGLVVFPWTVNTTGDLLTTIEMGVDGIITNYPQTLKNLLSTRK